MGSNLSDVVLFGTFYIHKTGAYYLLFKKKKLIGFDPLKPNQFSLLIWCHLFN